MLGEALEQHASDELLGLHIQLELNVVGEELRDVEGLAEVRPQQFAGGASRVDRGLKVGVLVMSAGPRFFTKKMGGEMNSPPTLGQQLRVLITSSSLQSSWLQASPQAWLLLPLS
jgi:hypothetical protein